MPSSPADSAEGLPKAHQGWAWGSNTTGTQGSACQRLKVLVLWDKSVFLHSSASAAAQFWGSSAARLKSSAARQCRYNTRQDRSQAHWAQPRRELAQPRRALSPDWARQPSAAAGAAGCSGRWAPVHCRPGRVSTRCAEERRKPHGAAWAPGRQPQAALYARLEAGGVGQGELHEVRYPLGRPVVTCACRKQLTDGCSPGSMPLLACTSPCHAVAPSQALAKPWSSMPYELHAHAASGVLHCRTRRCSTIAKQCPLDQLLQLGVGLV